MNCDECREKLQKYVEGSLSYEADEEVRQHLLNCPECSRRYEEEKLEYQMFKEAFQFKEVDFNDTTSGIMNSIDKNKYKSKKAVFLRHRKAFGALAAAVMICIVSVPVISSITGRSDKDMLTSFESSIGSRNLGENEQTDSEIEVLESSKESKDTALDKSSNKEETNEDENISFGPNYYEKSEAGESINFQFNTPYIKAPDGRFEATIEGRGEYGVDEGEGIIYVNDEEENKIYRFKSEDTRKDYSALNIGWYDDTHLMIVHGYEFGTLNNGIELIMMDVTTGNQKIIYEADDNVNERIIKAYVNEYGVLTIDKGRYVDDSLNEFAEETEVYDGYKLWDVIK